MIWPKNDSNPNCDYDNLWSSNTFCEINHFKEFLLPLNITIEQKTPNNLYGNIDILGYSSNFYNEKQIQKIVNKFKPKILIHTSDEKGDRPKHNDITGVNIILRQYNWYNYNNKPHIYQLPLGYHCWDNGNILPIVPIYNRKYIFSFIGTPKGKREEQANELKKEFDSFFVGKTTPNKNKYIYNQTIFAFCPKGNIVYNCYRNYIAMKNGCIPIIILDKKNYDEQFSNILSGPPPFIYKSTSNELIKEMKRLLNNKHELDNLSQLQIKWYNNNIKSIQNIIKHNLLN